MIITVVFTGISKCLNSQSQILKILLCFLDTADCEICDEALQNLEDIDDDADAVGVRMIKTDDLEFAQEIGISEFPSIVYYEHGNPHIYDGKPLVNDIDYCNRATNGRGL